MTAEVIDFDQAKAQRTSRPPRISVGLRNVSRDCRKEILRTHSYHAFWLGGVSKEQYAELFRLSDRVLPGDPMFGFIDKC